MYLGKKKMGVVLCLSLCPWPKQILLSIHPHFLPQGSIINHDRRTKKKVQLCFLSSGCQILNKLHFYMNANFPPYFDIYKYAVRSHLKMCSNSYKKPQ